MKYFVLNISEGKNKNFQKNAVDKWIGEEKFAPIFYGEHTINEILDDCKNTGFSTDEKYFIKEFSTDITNKILVSIGIKKIYIYRPIENCRHFERWSFDVNEGEKTEDKLCPKGFSIEILSEIPIVDAPLVLSTIKSNAWLGRGTFRDIKDDKPGSYFGNIKAIEWILSKKESISVNSFTEYLLCLSSLEFETLIAKYREEAGLFVPAYKGGFMRDLDLICKDYKTQKVVEKLQLKLHLFKDEYFDYIKKDPELLFYCITCDNEIMNKTNVYSAEKFKDNLLKSKNTMKWLRQTLNWVHY